MSTRGVDLHFMAKRRIGLAILSTANIRRHPLLRSTDDAHVARLCTSLQSDPNARHAHPLQVVPSDSVPMPWLGKLSRNSFLSDHDANAVYICIGGGHRLLAATQLCARPAPIDGPDERPFTWLCEVYTSGECASRIGSFPLTTLFQSTM